MLYTRSSALKNKINKFLVKLTQIEKNYFDELSQDDLLALKSTLSDVNNVLTLETTHAFLEWLKQLYLFDKTDYNRIVSDVENTKPNTNGFDIEITTNKAKILTEIKCIVPINSSNKFGSAQKNAILDDALKLLNGKRHLKNTESYHKFIGLIDVGTITDNAIQDLIKPVKTSTKNEQQIARNKVINKIRYIDNQINIDEISSEFVYIKRIKIRNNKS